MNTPIQNIADAVLDVVSSAARNPTLDVSATDVAPLTKAVVAEVAPAVLHATNNEPWYQSRVTVGNYVAMVSTIVGPLAGRAFSADEQALATAAITGIGVVVGALWSLYGRWKAKKPIGN